MTEPQANAALARALAALPTPSAPEQIWQRLQHSLDRQQSPRGLRGWLARWRSSGNWRSPSWGLAAVVCGAALFLWFGEVNDVGRSIETDAATDPTTPLSLAAVEQDIARLQRVSAQLEAQLGNRRADSTRYDDELAWTEAAIAAALADVDRTLASAPEPTAERSLWIRRVALLAGLNEQAQDPLPLGRVDWVQVD